MLLKWLLLPIASDVDEGTDINLSFLSQNLWVLLINILLWIWRTIECHLIERFAHTSYTYRSQQLKAFVSTLLLLTFWESTNSISLLGTVGVGGMGKSFDWVTWFKKLLLKFGKLLCYLGHSASVPVGERSIGVCANKKKTHLITSDRPYATSSSTESLMYNLWLLLPRRLPCQLRALNFCPNKRW